MDEIKLYIINLDIGFSHKHHLLKVINESQKEKASKYKNDKDQMRSLLSSYLKKKVNHILLMVHTLIFLILVNMLF